MLLKRRTDKPKIKTFQIALHAYKRVTQHMGTPLSDIYISFRKSKGFNLRSLTPKISICHGSFLLFMILVCFWPVLKHRWTNIEGIVFPAKLHITHSELFRLFCMWWREPKVLLQGLLKNFIPDIFSYLLLIIDKNKIVRKKCFAYFHQLSSQYEMRYNKNKTPQTPYRLH